MSVLRSRRFLSSVVIVIVAVLAYTQVLDMAADRAGMHPLKDASDVYLTKWTNLALATAGTAAVVNAGLSVIEDSELQAQPAGLGASIALGDAVRPVNDVVSRLVSVTLASAVALQVQRTLIDIGVKVGLKWFLTLSMVFLLLTVWLDWPLVRRLAWGFFVLALVTGFLIPGAVFITGKIGDHYTQETYATTQLEFERLKSDTMDIKDSIVSAVSNPEGGLNPVKRFREVEGQLSRLVESLADMTRAIGKAAVNLSAVFIVQTMLMPLLILWALIKLPGYLLNPAGMEGARDRFLSLLRGSGRPEDGSPPTSEAVAPVQL